MRRLARAAVALSTLVTLDVAAVRAQPEPGAKSGQGALMDPGQGFGAAYGTDNLASPSPRGQPLAEQPPTAPGLPNFGAALNAGALPPSGLATYRGRQPADQSPQTSTDPVLQVLLEWNDAALDMTSIDHTTAGRMVQVESRSGLVDRRVFESTYGEQFGPPRTSRAMAIVHLAMFEAVNAIDRRYNSYRPAGDDGTLQAHILERLSLPVAPDPATASRAAAITEAAYRTLIELYPRKTALIDKHLLEISPHVSALEGATNRDNALARLKLGKEIGFLAAELVMRARADDNSNKKDGTSNCGFDLKLTNQSPDTRTPEPLCFESNFLKGDPKGTPLDWTYDAILPQSLKLGKNWGQVTPFVLDKHQFIKPDGIDLGSGQKLAFTDIRHLEESAEFRNGVDAPGYGDKIPDPRGAVDEHGHPMMIDSKYGVRMFGGYDPSPTTPLGDYPRDQGKRYITGSDRTEAQTKAGQFWGYDATAVLCAPPRLYNMVAVAIYRERLDSKTVPHTPPTDPRIAVDAARYLALVNLALADSGVAAWDAKYTYNVARPVTFLRNQPETPKTNDDGTMAIKGDQYWTPLGQVSSNGAIPNVTPPFPSYPSGHAVFGAAAFEMISKVLGMDKDKEAFDFISDEYNDHTIGDDAMVRHVDPAHFISLRAAEWENAESRIFLGIHWQKDADDGILLGDKIADTIFERALTPISPTEQVAKK